MGKNPSITDHVVRASDSIRVSAPAPQQLLETSVLFPHLAPLSGETTPNDINAAAVWKGRIEGLCFLSSLASMETPSHGQSENSKPVSLRQLFFPLIYPALPGHRHLWCPVFSNSGAPMEMGMLGNPSSSDPLGRYPKKRTRQDRIVLFTQSITNKISITSSNSKQHPEHKVLQAKQKQASPSRFPAVRRNTIPHPQPKPCPVMPYSRSPMLQISKKATRNDISSPLPCCQSPEKTVNHHPPFSSSLLLPILRTRGCDRSIKSPNQPNLVQKNACPVIQPCYPSLVSV